MVAVAFSIGGDFTWTGSALFSSSSFIVSSTNDASITAAATLQLDALIVRIANSTAEALQLGNLGASVTISGDIMNIITNTSLNIDSSNLLQVGNTDATLIEIGNSAATFSIDGNDVTFNAANNFYLNGVALTDIGGTGSASASTLTRIYGATINIGNTASNTLLQIGQTASVWSCNGSTWTGTYSSGISLQSNTDFTIFAGTGVDLPTLHLDGSSNLVTLSGTAITITSSTGALNIGTSTSAPINIGNSTARTTLDGNTLNVPNLVTQTGAVAVPATVNPAGWSTVIWNNSTGQLAVYVQ